MNWALIEIELWKKLKTGVEKRREPSPAATSFVENYSGDH